MTFSIEKMWKNHITDPQRVISFSLFGKKRKYTGGAIQNVIIGETVYPEWTFRFYVDSSVKQKIIDELLELGAQVYKITTDEFDDKHFMNKAMWRFLVAGEKNVRFLCRDADARVNVREANAVKKWCKSGKQFIRMWDSRVHVNPILAGMWGGMSIEKGKSNKKKTGEDCNEDKSGESVPAVPNIEKKMRDWVKKDVKTKFTDEYFLRENVLPLMKKSEIKFGSGGKDGEYSGIPFDITLRHPTGINNFVGHTVNSRNDPRWKSENWEKYFIEGTSKKE